MIKNFTHKDDVNARHPMDLRYMKLLRYFLRMVSAWPDHLLGEQVRPFHLLKDSRCLFTVYAFTLVTGIIYLKTNFNKISFFELGQTYLTVFLNSIGLQRLTISWLKSYNQLIEEFVLTLHLFHHRHETEYSEYIYQYINKICAVFVTALHTETFFGIFFYNLTSVYNNYKKGMFDREKPPDQLFEHSINYSIPFINYHSDLVGYIVMALLNLFLTLNCSLCFCVFDVTLSVIVFHIWGHLKILDNKLLSIPTPVEMRGQETRPGRADDELLYSAKENEKAAEILKDIVDHHRLIMRFMTKTSDTFGPMLCLYYTFHQVSGCILLLECSRMDTESLTRYGALTLTLFQLLIQISIIVELLGSQSETLKDAVYSVPWEYMDTSNRKIVLFLLCNVQEPIRLKPLGIVFVGVQTMATILKTSFSYFMLLQTFD